MALSEAIAYMDWLDNNVENWSRLPNNDPHIIALQRLGVTEDHDIPKPREPRKPFLVKAVQANEKAKIYESVKECAEEMGFNTANIYQSMERGSASRGVTFEKIFIKEE